MPQLNGACAMNENGKEMFLLFSEDGWYTGTHKIEQ